MRWTDRLVFLIALLSLASLARGGAVRLTFDAIEPHDMPLLRSTIDALPTVLFADEPLASLWRTDDAPEPIISIERPAAVATSDEPALQLLPMEHYLTPVTPTAAPVALQVTTVAVPLPPAAVGGAIAAATLLGGPLLSGRCRRRRAACTFR